MLNANHKINIFYADIEKKHRRENKLMLEFFKRTRLQFLNKIFYSMFYSFFRKQSALAALFSALLIFSAVSFNFAQEDAANDDTQEAVKLFNEGQDAHEKGDLKTAVELYQKALEKFPDFPEAEYQLGNAFLALEKTAEAEKSFRRAIELREDWSLPMASLGGILVDRNEFKEAETILLKAIELDEMNFPAYTALTELRLKTKAAPEVLKQLLTKLQFLTSKASPTASIWAARASVERTLGDRSAAKSSVNRALAIEPNNKSAWTERIEINLAENDFKAALENAKSFIKIAPDSIIAKFLLARAFAANGNAEEALKILDSVSNMTNEMIAFRDRIIATTTVNAADLEKQLEAEPKSAPILGRLCAILRVDDPQKALDYCRRAYEAEPNNLTHVIGFGAALVQAKQYPNAVVIFQKIIAIAPDNYTAHANLAVALFQLKQYADAKKEYQWLREKQPDLAITYYFLGIVHDQLKEYADAMANYQQFLRLADSEKNKLEIEKVNLRLPVLQKQIKKK